VNKLLLIHALSCPGIISEFVGPVKLAHILMWYFRGNGRGRLGYQATLAKTLKYRNDAGSIEIAGYERFPSVVSLARIGG